MGIQISIDGLDGVMNSLQNLISGDKLQNALAEAGEVVRADAVDNCPVDTGRLKGSITSAVEGNSAIIGTNVEYGIYVGFGTGSKEWQNQDYSVLSRNYHIYLYPWVVSILPL